MNEEMKNLKTAKEISKMFPIWSERTFRIYASQGKVPCIRIGKKRKKPFFDPEEIEKFFDSQKIVEKGDK